MHPVQRFCGNIMTYNNNMRWNICSKKTGSLARQKKKGKGENEFCK